MIKATDPDATYTISNISLEFDTVTNTSLASQIRTEYMKSSIFYMIEFLELALYHSTIPIRASPLISIAHQKVLNVYYSFLRKKGVPLYFSRDTEEFFNPKITKVEVTVEGVPNELYA